MKRLIQQRYVFRQNLIVVIGVCLTFYFAYHLIAGQRSYMRMISLDRQIETMDDKYAATMTQRESIEAKVVMMRPGSVSRDLLEEQARKVLGFQYEDEKIVLKGIN